MASTNKRKIVKYFREGNFHVLTVSKLVAFTVNLRPLSSDGNFALNDKILPWFSFMKQPSRTKKTTMYGVVFPWVFIGMSLFNKSK